MSRFYVLAHPLALSFFDLPDDCAHHAARVLRLCIDDVITLFNGDGGEWLARITHIDRQRVRVFVERYLIVDRESALQTHLIQGISSGDRMDYTLQKAVELGITHIYPVTCTRSVVRLRGERASKKREHWQQLVIAACEQCGRNTLPTVADITDLAECLSRQTAGVRIVLDPRAKRTLQHCSKPDSSVAVLVGPEGGFAVEELDAALRCGFVAARLGPRILRTETAGVVAMTAIQWLWGDLAI